MIFQAFAEQDGSFYRRNIVKKQVIQIIMTRKENSSTLHSLNYPIYPYMCKVYKSVYKSYASGKTADTQRRKEEKKKKLCV